MAEPQFRNDVNKHRYALVVDEAVVAYAEYNELSVGLMFTHTEVLAEHEGKGYGGQLARYALDDARARGKQVIPVCQFIAGYIRRHREYLDLLTPDARRAFQI